MAMSDNKNMRWEVKALRSEMYRRVICFECGKEFADLLSSLLIMPVGTILKHLKELDESTFLSDRKSPIVAPVIHGGGYSGGDYFLRLSIAQKEKCLNAQCGNETQFKGQICDDCEAVQWNSCLNLRQPPQSSMPNLHKCLTNFKNQAYTANKCPSCGHAASHCPSCHQSVSHHVVVLRRKGVHTSSSGGGSTNRGGGGFVEKDMFMIKEDLSISESTPYSILALLQSLKTDFSDVDMKEVAVGMKEGLLLVRAAMVSKKPLTDVFGSFFG